MDRDLFIAGIILILIVFLCLSKKDDVSVEEHGAIAFNRQNDQIPWRTALLSLGVLAVVVSFLKG